MPFSVTRRRTAGTTGACCESRRSGAGDRGGAVLALEVELDGLADPHVLDAGPAQAVQRVLDRLALHVQDAGLEEHVDLGAH